MKTAGVVFDFYDDPTGSVLKTAFPTPDDLPEIVKTAHILSPEEHEVLRDDAYALRMNNEGKVLRKFACVDAGNTLLSMLYLEQAAEVLPEEAIKVAAANIAEFAESFGLELTPFIKQSMTKEALFGLSARERAEADMVRRHNAWVDEMNHPDNIKKLNEVHSHILKTKFKTTQADATEEQHRSALDESYKHPHFAAIHKKHWSKEKTSATGMGRQRDSMRQPMVGDEADWAARTNLVSVRGGGDSGRVIPTANQMKTAGVEKTAGRDDVIKEKVKNLFKSVVDVSGAQLKPKTKRSAAENTALGRYPLDSYGDVRAAVNYFDEHWTEFSPSERHVFAVKTASRAEALGIPTSELLGRYGSTEYAPDLEAHIASRKASAPREFSDSYNLLKEKRSSVSPDQFVELLSEIDKAAGLNWHYGASICDPYLATFGGKEKSASAEPWHWEGANGESVDKMALMAIPSETINKNFSADVAEAFLKDPVGIFESMPDTTKTILAGLAKVEG